MCKDPSSKVPPAECELPADFDQRITVNGLGLECPEPLQLLRKCVREAKEGQLIEVLSEDPVSRRDIPAFCEFMKHTLVSMPSKKQTKTDYSNNARKCGTTHCISITIWHRHSYAASAP